MKIYIPWLKTYFNKNLPNGKDLAKALSEHTLETEYEEEENILNVDVLPHRSADCLSHYGIALEISAILNIPIAKNFFEPSRMMRKDGKGVQVWVEDKELSPRFFAVRIKNINNKVTIPDWMKEYLNSIDQRSINPIVDITNYVMFELGHPLHAFDVKNLAKKENGDVSIGVKQSGVNDIITLLDGKMITIPENTPIITDRVKNHILGLAGIKGGKHALVTGETNEIILECAHFKRANIYKSARNLSIHTDASYRFERNLSIHAIPYVAYRVVELLKEITGAEVCGVDDTDKKEGKQYMIPLDTDTITSISGKKASPRNVEYIFNRLGFEYKKTTNIRADVVEEIKKHIGKKYIYGASVSKDAPDAFDCSSLVNYCFLKHGILLPRISANMYYYARKINKQDIQPGDCFFSENPSGEGNWYDTRGKESFIYLPPQEPLKEPVGHIGMYIGDGKVIHAQGGSVGKVVEDDLETLVNRYAHIRFGSFIQEKKHGWFEQKNTYYTLYQPINRTDISIPEDVVEEYVRIKGLSSFVSHKNYDKTEKKQKIDKKLWYHFALVQQFQEAGFHETITQSLGKTGDIKTVYPLNKDKMYLRKTLTTGLEIALEKNKEHMELFGKDSVCMYEIGSVFTKKGEKTMLGFIVGRKKTFNGMKNEADIIQKVIEEVCGIHIHISLQENTAIEIDFDNLIAQAKDIEEGTPYPSLGFRQKTHKPISPYPIITRDIAVFVPKEILPQDVASYIEKYGDETLVSYRLFDTFQKDDKVSYAFRIVFQSNEKTLQDAEVNTSMEAIEKNIQKRKHWEIR